MDTGTMMLTWQPAGAKPVSYELPPDRATTIGRDAANHVVLESTYVSKAHAIIRFSKGEWIVEDLMSANGTTVNGAEVRRSVLHPADIIMIGDQRLLFAPDKKAGSRRSQAQQGSPQKTTRLVIAALATALVMIVIMMLLVPTSPPPGDTPARAPVGPRSRVEPGPLGTNPDLIGHVLRRVDVSGVGAVDALVDEAVLSVNSGRLLEAAQLLGAAVERSPRDAALRRRFDQVQQDREEAILQHIAQASRASEALRYDDATVEWEAAASLTSAVDPRHQQALERAEQARRVARRSPPATLR